MPSKSIAGSSGAPAMRVCASACSMRATAAAMSRLARCARSTSVVSSRERKPRHQSGAGSAACGLPAAARYFGGTSTTGPGTVSVVSMQPDSSGASASASAPRTARPPDCLGSPIVLTVSLLSDQRVLVLGRGGGQSASLCASLGRHLAGRARDDLLHRLLVGRTRGAHLAVALRAAARHRTARARSAACMRSNARLSASRAPSAAASRARNAARSFSASAAGSGAARRSMRAAAVRGRSVAAGCGGAT